MAIVFESISSDVAVDADDTTISPAVPSGTEDGDLLVAISITGAGKIQAVPEGWTQFIDEEGYTFIPLNAWYKIASNESGTYDFTVATHSYGHIVVCRISGSDTDTPPTGSAQGDGVWDNSIVCPDKEVATADSILLWFGGCAGTATYTSNRGGEEYDVSDAYAVALAVYNETIAETGNQSGATITRSAAKNVKSGGVLLITPAAAGSSFKPAWARHCNTLMGAGI